MSKHISSLERELGVRLFDRTRRRVELTQSGELLLRDAQRLVELSARFSQNARRVKDGLVGTLRLGYSGPVSESALPELIRAHHRNFPDMILSLRESTTQSILDDVRDGVYDAAFVRYTGEPSDVTLLEVKQEPAIVAVFEDHPFYQRDDLSFAELRDQPLVMMTRDVEPQLYDHAITLCAGAGFSPSIVHEADSVQTTLAMVASGLGLAVVTSSARLTSREGVRYLDLHDPTPSVSLWLAHRRDHQSPALTAFLKTVLQMRQEWSKR